MVTRSAFEACGTDSSTSSTRTPPKPWASLLVNNFSRPLRSWTFRTGLNMYLSPSTTSTLGLFNSAWQQQTHTNSFHYGNCENTNTYKQFPLWQLLKYKHIQTVSTVATVKIQTHTNTFHFPLQQLLKYKHIKTVSTETIVKIQTHTNSFHCGNC